jgi:hypothetical protein
MVLIRKQFMPDASNGNGGATPKKTKKAGQPNADSDFETTSKKISDKWLATPAITLAWIDAATHQSLVEQFSDTYGQRLSQGSSRPSQTNTLKQINEYINQGAAEVKTYIIKKFKGEKNAIPEYARFGFVHKNGGYIIPRDNNERKNALPLMIAAIDADGFGSEDYGSTFWTDIKTQFEDALNAANTTDGKVSETVGNKNQLKKQIKKIHTALRYVLRGNYPDTYKAEFRAWGWQKEDY